MVSSQLFVQYILRPVLLLLLLLALNPLRTRVLDCQSTGHNRTEFYWSLIDTQLLVTQKAK